MTEPESEPEFHLESWEKVFKTEVYQVNAGWYLEITIPHPDNPEMPNQSMTLKCDNEWWARYLDACIHDLTDVNELLNNFLEEAPEFRYEG